MKTMTRRIAGMTLAVMMALVMLVGALPAKAYAAGETGSLTVSGHAELAGKNVTIVKMFSATRGGDNVGYTLESAWEAFFQGLDESTMDGLTGAELSQAAYTYVSKMTKDSTELTTFAKKAREYVRNNSAAFNDLSSTEKAGEAVQDKASATFADVAYGYYLAFPADGSTSADRKTDATLVNVLDMGVTWNIKSEYPTVDKIVANANGNSASVGDELTFTLTSKVPDMSDYNQYVFNFVDKLSAGLTLNQQSVRVTIDGAPLTIATDYTVDEQTVETDKTQLTISMVDFKNKYSDKAGKEIKVTYKATLNDKAIVDDGNVGNTNEAKVEYSNDPSSDGKGTSTPDVTHTHTFKFGINKQDDKQAALARAEFKIWKDDGNGVFNDGDTVLKFDKDALSEKYTLNASGNVETITTIDTGKFSVEGLEEGTYWVEEVNPPAGYNKLPKPEKVVIAAEYNDDGTLKSHSVKYGDALDKEAAHGDHSIVIVNKAGTLLPETGGMGTIAFTVIGAAVVVGGVAWAVRRKNVQR